MGPYDLYLIGAAIALVTGTISFLGRTNDFLLLLFSMSSILLFALRAADFSALLCVTAVICFVTFSSAVYVASRIIQGVAAALSSQAGSNIVLRTSILWLPLPVLLFASTLITDEFHKWVAKKLYAIELSGWHCGDSKFLLCKDEKGVFQNSLHRTNSRFFFDANSLVHKQTEQLRILPLSTEPDFRNKVNGALFGDNPIIPSADALLGRRMDGCSGLAWVLRFTYCIKTIIFNPIHDEYQKFLTGLKENLNEYITEEFARSQTTADVIANTVYVNLDRQLQRAQGITDRSIDLFYFIWNGVSTFFLIVAILTELKILFYIAARLAYDENNTSPISCSLSDGISSHTRIAATLLQPQANSSSPGQQNLTLSPGQQNLTLPRNQQVLYVTVSAKGAQPNFYGKFCWPHKSGLFLRRLIHNKLFFNKYDQQSPASIPINSELTNAFCSIELREGDCFAFSMKTLFAFTENVTFHLAIRIRAAILLQRRFLFATATGPGTIVLVARGGVLAILPNPPNVLHSNIDDVIGLDLKGSFYTNAQHNFIDTYFRSFAVKPEIDTLMIREAPQKPWSLARVLRRLGHLLLPI